MSSCIFNEYIHFDYAVKKKNDMTLYLNSTVNAVQYNKYIFCLFYRIVSWEEQTAEGHMNTVLGAEETAQPAPVPVISPAFHSSQLRTERSHSSLPLDRSRSFELCRGEVVGCIVLCLGLRPAQVITIQSIAFPDELTQLSGLKV